jgi:hypothetical protein
MRNPWPYVLLVLIVGAVLLAMWLRDNALWNW